MIALAIAGLLIANIPGMQLVWLLLFFAVLRAAVWLPSMISLLKPKWVTEPGMFWGIILAAVPGEALFVWGKMVGGGSFVVFAGTLVAILENYQQSDGSSVLIPKVLHKYMSGLSIIKL